MRRERKWISGAIKRPGALRRKFTRMFGLKKGHNITASMYARGYKRAKARGDTRTMRQINLARSLAFEQRTDDLRRDRGKQNPVSEMAGGEDEAIECARANDRRVVRRSRSQPRTGFDELELGNLGNGSIGLAQKLVNPGRTHLRVEPALLDGRADNNLPVLSRHDVGALTADDPAYDGVG